MPEAYEKIVVLDDEVQAQLLASILTERGIPHRMHSYYSRALDGIFQMQAGWGHLAAPDRFREEILALLDEMDEGASADGPPSEPTLPPEVEDQDGD